MLRRAHPSATALMLAAAAGVAACPAAGQSAGGAPKATATHPSGAAAGSGDAALPRLAPVTIAAVGDTMLGNTPDLPPHPEGYFGAVRRELGRGAPSAVGHPESPPPTAPGRTS